MMITWLLLVSLICTQDGDGQETAVFDCGPQNLILTTSDQTITSTWEDDASCFSLQDTLTYELLVLIADEKAHYEEIAVTPDQIGSTHSWKWMSHLPLECAPHSVRLRSQYKNRTSPWKQEQIITEREDSEHIEVFPQDREFEVGSRVTFCCILPAGEIFNKMFLMGYSDADMNTTKISDQIYALTVQLNQPSNVSCTNVLCESSSLFNGACAYIGYPPGDRDLQCETRNLQSVECHWTVGNTHLAHKIQTFYHLGSHQCVDGYLGRCEMEMQVDAGEQIWKLTAQNVLGKVELSDSADPTKRVRMLAPEGLRASSVHARNVTLEWRWTVQQYDNLDITCQVKVSHGETVTVIKAAGIGLRFAVLNNLIPHWTYNVTVRCGTTQHFWSWGDWSTSVNVLTNSDVPDALNVWMKVKGDQVLIFWKAPLANQSHGHIEHYEVTWAKTTQREQQNRTKVNNMHRLALSLDTTDEYIVTVAARNRNGSSAPSTITIPSLLSDRAEKVKTSRIIGSNGSFSLSWTPSSTASCGYIVDWCPVLRQCNLEWLKVPPNETNASIFSKNFIEGMRYCVSVYACTLGSPVLLERREGYVREKRIEDGLFKSLKWKQLDSDVEVTWDPLNPREQSAFIQGYIVYCLGVNNSIVFNVSTDNPEATKLTVRHLNISSFYTFIVKAQTALGECGTTLFTATLNSPTDNLVKPVLISLVTVFCLLAIFVILCYRNWTCITQKVYPPIPKPVLTDKWLTSPGFGPLGMAHCHQGEADIVDVCALHCNSETLNKSSVSEENMPFVYSQTAKGYYNQPLKKYTPVPITLPSQALPSQAGLVCSPLQIVTNLSYNLIMQTEDQQCTSDVELQEGPSVERSSSGCQSQSDAETVTGNQTAEVSMTCDFTYVLLPQSATK